MNWLLIIVLLVLVIAMMIDGMRAPGRPYEFPFLAGATCFGFILPQLPGLAQDHFLPDGAFTKAMVMTILCMTMCWIGFRWTAAPVRSLGWCFDEGRLLRLALVLSLAGAYFYFKLSRLPAELRLTTMATGYPVVFLFFAKMLGYGFAVAMICYMRRPSKFALAIGLMDAAFYLDRAIIAGKRGELAEFAFIILLAAWFHRGIAIPRTLAMGLLLVATIGMVSVGEYRSVTKTRDEVRWSDLGNIDVVANFEALLQTGGPEMRNAILRVHYTDRAQTFDFGVFHWNTIVFNFVPAQLVGERVKQSLRIADFDAVIDRDYDPSVGSTETGMADAFGSLWYFGAVKFLLIALVLSALYRAAMAGHTVAQLFYIFTLAPAMQAITHHTQWVLSAWLYMAILLLPGLALARVAAPAPRDPIPAPRLRDRVQRA
jgi:hypothetical protein